MTGFGFSALIYNPYMDNYCLFDTGGDGKVLIHNINQFKVDIQNIKNIIISHSHFDHSGGLSKILAKNPNIKVYVPIGNLNSFQPKYPQNKIIGVENLLRIEKGLISSGQIGKSIREQALIIKKDDDVFLIVGCTHPGLENFILKAKEIGSLIGIIGGFHGFRKYSYLENISIIGACHCTSHTKAIRKRYPNNFKQICVGDSISF
ncbi:MAG: MBL fold metallo-hydrolase [Candidatus Lokiarchaeota archaeon]|nr:MBL fold metallo-hydrolase [Candidatus Lokiarchaeota archaeon]MBD3200848.1 MBL fold metallo-hydrolase [Candidatus Lokiarchaeota archaeon]